MAAPLDVDCILQSLDAHGVDYVLVGGLAGVLHGSPAMTNDADVVPSPDEANLGRLGDALRALDARIRSEAEPDGIAFDPHPSLLASMAMLNLTTRCGDLGIAFRPAALDDYDALVSASVRFEVAGVELRVASLDDIIRSKEAAGRAKDHATLPILRALREEIARQEDGR
jgi:hypothetical protein